MNRLMAGFALLILFSFLVFFTCAREKWHNTVETVNGVQVIHNPEQGMWHKDPRKVTMTKELSLGVENGDNNYVFSAVYDVEADSEGNIYVLDARNYRIQKYDSRGSYLLTIGTKGKGPGEFTRPRDMAIDPEGNLYCLDEGQGRVSKFDSLGNFTSSFKIDFRSFSIMTNSEKEIILVVVKGDKIFHVFDSEGTLKRSFGEPIKPPEEEGLESFHDLRVVGIKCCIARDNSIYHSNPYEYTISRYSREGKLMAKIDRVAPFYFPSRLVRKEYPHGLSITVASSPIPLSILAAEDAKVLSFIRYAEGEKMIWAIDIFDSVGNFLISHIGKHKGFGRCIDKRNRIYVISSDPFPIVLRYAISFD